MSSAYLSRTRRTSALAGLAIAAGTLAVQAADLEYQGKRYGSAYDDPRYADLYGDTPQPVERRYVEPFKPYAEPRHGYGQPPIPREPVYRGYEDRRFDERRFSEAPLPRHRAYATGPACLHRDEVRLGLERSGWHDFRDPQVIDRDTAYLSARRDGRLFQIKIDRCTGDILAKRPLDGYRPYADYGYRPYRTY